MQTLVFLNTEIAQQVAFPSETANGKVFLQRIEGVSGLQTNILSHTAPDQDGATFDDSHMKTRNITLQGVIFSDTYSNLNALKRTIINTFNPKNSCQLIYSNETYTKVINVRVEQTPAFSQDDKTRNHQTFFISLIALEPFWEDIDFNVEELALQSFGFYFELEIPSSGVEFGTESTTYRTITNDGDVEAPLKIYFYGPCTNPRVYNETTGEQISIIATLTANDYLEINTKKGSKSVIMRSFGGTTNGFSYVDISVSTFFQLVMGNNLISYDCDSGMEDASVRILYKNLFIGF